MKTIIPFLGILIFLASCSHKITRSGYSAPSSEHVNCDIPIKKMIKPDADISEKIGSIRLGDTGFSTSCSEADALRIIKTDGCAINADLIVITYEQRSDLVSSCYRCSADFFRINEGAQKEFKSDQDMDIDEVYNRVKQDKRNNGAYIVGAIIGGILGSLIFVL